MYVFIYIDIQLSPGPAEYDAVNYNVIKKAPPAYSLHARLTPNDDFTLPKGKLSNILIIKNIIIQHD